MASPSSNLLIFLSFPSRPFIFLSLSLCLPVSLSLSLPLFHSFLPPTSLSFPVLLSLSLTLSVFLSSSQILFLVMMFVENGKSTPLSQLRPPITRLPNTPLAPPLLPSPPCPSPSPASISRHISIFFGERFWVEKHISEGGALSHVKLRR